MKQAAADQLGLFEKRVLAPRAPTAPGYASGPISPTTGGALNAIEAVRVLSGLSIAIGGAVSRVTGTAWCASCVRSLDYLGAPTLIPLYAPVCREMGPILGEGFGCSACGNEFIAHRDERITHRWPQ